MKYLSREAHRNWVEQVLPANSENYVHGIEDFQEYTTSFTGLYVNDHFPVIESRSKSSGNLIFKSIIKLTKENPPDSEQAVSEDDVRMFSDRSFPQLNYQVVILQVGDDLKDSSRRYYVVPNWYVG